MSKFTPSTRAELITRRTYCRPIYRTEEIKDSEGNITEYKEIFSKLESWPDVVDRVISHQRWLWIRAKYGTSLNTEQEEELEELRQLMLSGKATLSGRCLWLGGTELSKQRESSLFNCSFTKVETVYDVVDVLWLLLQGCGVGFKPVRGTLNGFFRPIKNIEIIRSTKQPGEKGREDTIEKINHRTKEWTIQIGDSAEAWAKSIGKLLAGKYKVDKLILDFSEIRCAGERLKGYGWISSGDEAISKAYLKIVDILSKRAGNLLSAIDILDIINHLGTILSSRRSAEICLMDVDDSEAEIFATAKKDHYSNGNEHRSQSNNSLLFWSKPSKEKLEHVFDLMKKAGGSEPGFINAEAATKRAPFFSGVNPCAIN